MQVMFTDDVKAAFRGVDEEVFKLVENEPLVFALHVSFFLLSLNM